MIEQIMIDMILNVFIPPHELVEIFRTSLHSPLTSLTRKIILIESLLVGRIIYEGIAEDPRI